MAASKSPPPGNLGLACGAVNRLTDRSIALSKSDK